MSYLSELRAVWGTAPLLSVGVSVLVQDDHGRVLLQRRGDDGLWGILGGGLEPGEDFLTAAHRELYEESGLACSNLTLLSLEEGLVSGPEFYHRYPNGDEIYLVGMRAHGTLPAEALNDAAPDDSGETLELAWFALDKLPPLPSNINRAGLNVLRVRAGLPPLPLNPFPAPPPAADHMRRLREVVGTRPLFAPGANVIVADGEGHLLLLQHGSTGRWTLPGGGLAPGESLTDCAQRELRGATGLSAAHLEPLRMYAGAECRFTRLNGDVIDNISVLYRARGVTGTPTLPPGEIPGTAWFARNELPGEDEFSGAVGWAMMREWADSCPPDRFPS